MAHLRIEVHELKSNEESFAVNNSKAF